MARPIINIDTLIIGNNYNRYCIEARVVSKSREIKCSYSGKISYFYLDLVDDTGRVRALFYKGWSTIKTMDEFYQNIKLDDIVLFNEFVVKKSKSDSKDINPNIQLDFDSISYEISTGRVMDYSEKISFSNKNGQIFSNKNLFHIIII